MPEMFGGTHPTSFQRWLAPVLLPLGGEHFEFAEASRDAGTAADACRRSPWPRSAGSSPTSLYKQGLRLRARDALGHASPSCTACSRTSSTSTSSTTRVFVGGTLAFSRALSWFDANIIDGIVNGVRHVTVIVLGHGSSLFDQYVVDGAVNGVGFSARGGSRLFRRVQSGFVQNYALVMGGGIVLDRRGLPVYEAMLRGTTDRWAFSTSSPTSR